MTKAKSELGLNEELMVLQFWAHGMDIRQKFSKEQIRAVPSLGKAIAAVSRLSDEIGWGDEPQRSSKQRKKSASPP
jgi:hypothetical protein